MGAGRGWQRPLCNRAVYSTSGGFLGRPDLLDPETGVAGEYDGALHRGRARHRSDVGRAELMRGHGLEPFVIVAGDGPEVQVSRMAAARARAMSGPRRRSWTIDPPAALVPAVMSLDEELELRGWTAD